MVHEEDSGLPSSGTPFFLFRRLPDGAERAARTRELYPDALGRGRLPGMRAWPAPVLTLPEAREQVKLLHARITVDYHGALGRQRFRPWLVGLPAVFLLFLVVNGELHAAGLRVAGVLVAALLLTVTASRIFMRRRRAAAGTAEARGDPLAARPGQGRSTIFPTWRLRASSCWASAAWSRGKAAATRGRKSPRRASSMSRAKWRGVCMAEPMTCALWR